MPSPPARAPEASPRHGGHVPAMQRRRLFVALVELAGEHGLEAANIGAICARAGVSRRTYYELFKDREACLLEAFERSVEQLATCVRSVQQEHAGWQERIRASLCSLLEQLDREPDLARLCLVEMQRAGPAVMAQRQRVLDSLAAAVDEGRLKARQAGELPPLMAQGIVGGVLTVVQAQLLESEHPPLVKLTNQLMAMIVHPYLGPAAARRELACTDAVKQSAVHKALKDPFNGLPIRFTYRTARVLTAISSQPAASNRAVADASGVGDEGQASRLLRRLENAGLVENLSAGRAKGEPNAWRLTARGEAVQAALDARTAYSAAA